MITTNFTDGRLDSRTTEQKLAAIKRTLLINRRERNRRLRDLRKYQHEANTGTYRAYEGHIATHTPEQQACLRRDQQGRVSSARFYNRRIVKALQDKRNLP